MFCPPAQRCGHAATLGLFRQLVTTRNGLRYESAATPLALAIHRTTIPKVVAGASTLGFASKLRWSFPRPPLLSQETAKSPAADLAAADKLIHACGYHRRDEELADAKRAILCTS